MNLSSFSGVMFVCVWVVYSLGSVTYLHRASDRGMETATRSPVPLHMIHMPAQTAWGCPSWVLHLFPCPRPVNVCWFVLSESVRQQRSGWGWGCVSPRALPSLYMRPVIVMWSVSRGGSSGRRMLGFVLLNDYTSHEAFKLERCKRFLGCVVLEW